MLGEDYLKLDEGIKGYLCFLYCLVVVFVIWFVFVEISCCLMKVDFGGRDVWSLMVLWDFWCDYMDCEICFYLEGDVVWNCLFFLYLFLYDIKWYCWLENDNCGESISDFFVNLMFLLCCFSF